MIERLVESWLDSSTERSFQAPFCQILISQGFKVLHLTRHWGMELGKDIIAVAPDGTPHVYQLKTARGPRITLEDWRSSNMQQQVFDMVVGSVEHPSLSPASRRKAKRSFLVTNRELDEAVIRQIADMNRQWSEQGQGHCHLEVKARGDLLRDAIDLGGNLWPSELTDIRSLLDLFLEDGRGPLPKEKLCKLLLATMPLLVDSKPAKTHCRRAVASAGLLCAIAIREFTKEGNYCAQIDAWTLYLSHLLAVAEKWGLPATNWKPEYDLAKLLIRNGLDELLEELGKRQHLLHGDAIHDRFVRGVRVVRLIGLVSLYALWKKSEAPNEPFDDGAKDFCKKYLPQMDLWGEAAVPSIVLLYWFWRRVMPDAHRILFDTIREICRRNHPGAAGAVGLPTPYYSESDVLRARIEEGDSYDEDFSRQSYMLEGLVHLFVRQNWKQHMVLLWPDITRITYSSFVPDSRWEFLLWRTENGVQKTVCHNQLTKEWSVLRAEAGEANGESVPSVLKDDPLICALLLTVLPHRANASVFRWLDTRIEAMT